MQMTGYTKLFGSIVASTIWREPNTVRIVWITMLAMANKNGVVEASMPGLADLSRVSMDDCEAALAALMSPDKHSRTSDNEGRRIAVVDGGWLILNHGKYRAKMGADERREYLRIKQQESRDRRRSSTDVNNRSDSSTQSTHAEADSEAKAATPEEPPIPKPSVSRKKVVEVSERGLKFADWFKTTLATDVRLSANWRENWARCYDDMLRLDKRTPEQIAAVCKWARADSFWASNFQSPLKLRERKNGVQYFDSFTEKMKAPPRGRNGAPSRAECPRHDSDERL